MAIKAIVSPKQDKVLTVILNWNGPQNTLTCLEHVQRQTTHSSIMIIDNGSTDDSVRILEQMQTGITVLFLPQNVGFAAGMNHGVDVALASDFDYVWLLNNDAFPEPRCLQQLVDHMNASSSTGMCTPNIHNEELNPEHVGGSIVTNHFEPEVSLAEELPTIPLRERWITGTAPLLRCDSIRIVGKFDERFFAYWEDVDLSSRLAEAGFDLDCVEDAAVTHIGNASTGGCPSPFTRMLHVRNSWLFQQKRMPLWRRPIEFGRFAKRRISESYRLANKPNPATFLASVATLAAIRAAALGIFGRPRNIQPLSCRVLARLFRLLDTFAKKKT